MIKKRLRINGIILSLHNNQVKVLSYEKIE